MTQPTTNTPTTMRAILPERTPAVLDTVAAPQIGEASQQSTTVRTLRIQMARMAFDTMVAQVAQMDQALTEASGNDTLTAQELIALSDAAWSLTKTVENGHREVVGMYVTREELDSLRAQRQQMTAKARAIAARAVAMGL